MMTLDNGLLFWATMYVGLYTGVLKAALVYN